MQFESDALLYCMLSAIVAYVVNGWFVGWQSLFQVPTHLGRNGSSRLWLVYRTGPSKWRGCDALPEIFYRTRDLFAAIPIPVWIKPAIGGLALGMLALWLPQVLKVAATAGFRRSNRRRLSLTHRCGFNPRENGRDVTHGFLRRLGRRLRTLPVCGRHVGSDFFRHPDHAPASLVVVGMAAVFGGAAGVPIATLLMVAEMTGGYQLLVPAGLAVMISFLIQINLSLLPEVRQPLRGAGCGLGRFPR